MLFVLPPISSPASRLPASPSLILRSSLKHEVMNGVHGGPGSSSIRSHMADKFFLFKKSKSPLELLLYDGGHSLVILAIASHLSESIGGSSAELLQESLHQTGVQVHAHRIADSH